MNYYNTILKCRSTRYYVYGVLGVSHNQLVNRCKLTLRVAGIKGRIKFISTSLSKVL